MAFTWLKSSMVILSFFTIMSIVIFTKFYAHNPEQSTLPVYTLLFLFLIVLLVVFFWRLVKDKKAQYREHLADALEEAIFLIQGPDGEQQFLDTLDRLIVSQKALMKHDYTLYEFYQRKAMIESFTWVASPSGVPGSREL